MTGGPYGGTKVDEGFVSLLERFFGTYQVKNFRENHPAEWLQIMNEFEMKKRGRRAHEGETTRICLPRTFTALVSEQGGPDLASRFASSCRTDDVQFVRNEYFCIGPAARPVPIVLVKCWKVTRWNAKKLLKNCQKYKKLLPKFQKLLPKFLAVFI